MVPYWIHLSILLMITPHEQVTNIVCESLMTELKDWYGQA